MANAFVNSSSAAKITGRSAGENRKESFVAIEYLFLLLSPLHIEFYLISRVNVSLFLNIFFKWNYIFDNFCLKQAFGEKIRVKKDVYLINLTLVLLVKYSMLKILHIYNYNIDIPLFNLIYLHLSI